jgi:hypothetical protein
MMLVLGEIDPPPPNFCYRDRFIFRGSHACAWVEQENIGSV